MPRILATCLLLALALPGHAQERKPNTLTPKEIADGWILLFDGETTFGWKIEEGMGANAITIKENALNLQQVWHGGFLSSSCFQDFDLSFDYRKQAGFAQVGVRNMLHSPHLGGTGSLLTHSGTWKPFTFRVSEKRIEQFLGAKWTTHSFLEFASLKPGPPLRIRNLKLHPLNMNPLFNGKDLTGWKVFPNKKSQFTVKDGAIHLTNGPGDLQTLGKYKDFILQLECKSNGKHLNSGIFFRCRDNEYQNGYEAQIRNQFTDKPTQKYLIEEYDPKTHKLIGKKEQFFTAVDYGTGAIYRRQPARKAMAKDGEWFTMTIVAHGNHFATWVNGIQVTDWTDNRPKSDNARKGCCLNAGHISIQGHDPTTDLSFRNIRIAELK